MPPTKVPPPPGYVTLMDAALALGITYHVALKHVCKGRLDGGKQNGHWYVRLDSVREFVERHGRHSDLRTVKARRGEAA